MKLSFVRWGILVLAAVSAASCNRRSGTASQAAGGAAVQSTAPGFELATLGGSRLSLQSFSGKRVLIHFWASWCPPCLPELPEILAFASRMESKGWQVLAIATDKDPAAVRKALPAGARLPPNFHVLLDSDSRVAEAFGSFMYPESYEVDPEGRIRQKWVGPQDWELLASRLP